MKTLRQRMFDLAGSLERSALQLRALALVEPPDAEAALDCAQEAEGAVGVFIGERLDSADSTKKVEKLRVTSDNDTTHEITREDAPSVFEAFDAWVAAPERSSKEAHLWNEVLEAASQYLQDEEFGDMAEDVQRV